jgi:hypothetical protein
MIAHELAADFEQLTGLKVQVARDALLTTRETYEAYLAFLHKTSQPPLLLAPTQDLPGAAITYKGYPLMLIPETSQPGGERHPLAPFAGILADNPIYDEWVEAMREYREQIEHDSEAI